MIMKKLALQKLRNLEYKRKHHLKIKEFRFKWANYWDKIEPKQIFFQIRRISVNKSTGNGLNRR